MFILKDHALREPDTTPMEEERIPNNLVELVEEETIEVQPGSPEKSEPKKDSFGMSLHRIFYILRSSVVINIFRFP